jgi:hypothetical protein
MTEIQSIQIAKMDQIYWVTCISWLFCHLKLIVDIDVLPIYM